MFCNKKYILLCFILFSSLFNQSYFNRILGSNIISGDARSLGIGQTYLTTEKSSNLVFSNPARISLLDNIISFDIQFNYNVLNERKSIIVKDFFDGTLANADIAFNQSSLYNYSIGATYNLKFFKNYKLGLAFSQKPLISFNYNYEEEIRDRESFDENHNTSLDPVVGYHIFKTEGNLNIQTVGLSLSYGVDKPYAIGVALNRIPPSEIKDVFYTNLLNPSINSSNMSIILDEVNHIYKVKAHKDYFLSYSVDLPIGEHLRLVYSIEENILISSDEYSLYQISPLVGLPLLVEFNGVCSDPLIQNEEECLGVVGATWENHLTYPLKGLFYEKPKIYNFGLLLNPSGNKNMTLAFEITEKKIKQHTDTKVIGNNIFELRLGLEHYLKNKFPIRAGLIYSEPIFDVLEPKTTFTLGTGAIIKNINIDFAMDYTIANYRYYDIFPINNVFENTCENDQYCNSVKESNLNFLTTIRVEF